MSDRPIRSATWTFYDIVGPVALDADYITVGLLLSGGGTAWIDSASLGEASDQPSVLSATSEAYLDEALKLLRERHINRDKIDWPATYSLAHTLADGAQTPTDTYPAIRAVIAALGEPHTYLVAAGPGSSSPTALVPSLTLIDRLYAMITLPSHAGGEDGADDRYVAAAREAILRTHPCGWIVDLRDNKGGDMWPMLNALAPLLDDGPFGAFLLPDGRRETWLRSGDTIGPGPGSGSALPRPRTAPRSTVPIAVLVGSRTASSGEMVAIALKDVQGVRLFGQPTAGFVIANRPARLSDGALLVVSEARVLDRHGEVIGAGLTPQTAAQEVDALGAALRWLSDQRCGAG